MMSRRLLLGAAVAAALLVVTGCGVPMQNAARPIPELSKAHTNTPSASPAERPVRLWFAGDTRLRPVVESRANTPTVGDLLGLLVAGPPAPTASPGTAGETLRTLLADPLTGSPLVSARDPGATPSGTVRVAVADTFNALPATEQVRLLGQVVLTLTDAGANAVSVTDTSGNTLAIPLPDGTLLTRPAVRSDYASLTNPASNSS